jgi:CHAT domain-containing protein/tetratricopeptide (TPR) repeat protein
MNVTPLLNLPESIRTLLAEDEAAGLSALIDHFLDRINVRDLDGCRSIINDLQNLPVQDRARAQAILIYFRGILALEERRWDQAERLFLELAQQSADLDLQRRALNELGILSARLWRWNDAYRYYQRALDAFESAGAQSYVARTLKNLGIAYMRAYNTGHATSEAPSRALDYYRRALSIFQSLDQTWQEGTTWHEMGTAYRALKQWEDALACYQRDLQICESQPDKPDVHGQSITLNNIGETYHLLRDWAAAHAHYQQALDLIESSDDPYHQADILSNLGRLANDQDQTDAAAAYYERAIGVFESLRTIITAVEPRLEFSGTVSKIYGEYVSVLAGRAGQIDRAFAIAERAKSRAFVEMLLNQPIAPSDQVRMDWIAEETRLRIEIRQRYEAGADASELESSLIDLRRRIGLHDPEFASVNVVAPLALEAVRAGLPEDTGLLEYFEAPDQLLVFVVTRQTVFVQPVPLAPRDVDSAFDHRGHLKGIAFDSSGRLRPPWVLEKLYDNLMAPVASYLRDLRRLLIVPHGKLHYVPFHALWDSQSHSYVLDRWAVQEAPSATTLFGYCQAKPPSPFTATVAFGYGGDDLPYAEAEAERIAALSGGRAFIGPSANRDTVLRKSPNARWVHFSCHGYFQPASPLLSGLQLADGILDTQDIFRRLRIQAELVTLSACETRLGQILPGDELIGLARAFMYAGTPALLASLWLVSDMSTRLLMERFYQRLNWTPMWSALRDAQVYLRQLSEDEVRQTLLADGVDAGDVERLVRRLAHARGARPDAPERIFAHPYFWAPFILLGGRVQAA